MLQCLKFLKIPNLPDFKVVKIMSIEVPSDKFLNFKKCLFCFISYQIHIFDTFWEKLDHALPWETQVIGFQVLEVLLQ